MPRWIISLPVWGAHVATFFSGPAESLLAALGDRRAHFVIHTDDRERDRLTDCLLNRPLYRSVSYLPVPPSNRYEAFGASHRKAIAMAETGEYVFLMCADMSLSVEAFAACEKRFAEGKRLVVGAANSTLPPPPPPGMESRLLAAWGLAHMHPIHRECFYGTGRSPTTATVYFKHDKGIDLRGFHLHTFACVKRDGLTFGQPTPDEKLPREFSEQEIHVVTDPDEMSAVETSPADRTFGLSTPVDAARLARWGSRDACDERHRWLFTHRINLAGVPGAEDQAIADDVLRMIKTGVYP